MNFFNAHFSKVSISTLIFTALSIILIWAPLYISSYIDADTGWLITCLKRFLDGGTYGQDFFETNPPLSFLIFLPAYPLFTYLSLDPKLSIVIIFFIYIFISLITIYFLFKTAGMQKQIAINFICAALLAETWCSGINFGQKDHLIFIFLLPSVVAQLILNYKKPKSNLTITIACIMGAIAICIKPHYALIPFILFLDRLRIEKKIKPIVLNYDFIPMLITGSLFLVLMFTVFKTYITVIIPENINSYNEAKTDFSAENFYIFWLFPILSGFLVLVKDHQSEEDKLENKIIYALIILTILLFIPLYIQNKWFHYQGLPFLCAGITSSVFALLSIIQTTQKYALLKSIFCICIFIAFFFPYIYGPPSIPVMKAKEFLNIPYNLDIIKYAKNKKIFSTDLYPLTTALPLYTDLIETSRFAQIWPLSSDLEKLSSSENTKEDITAINSHMEKIISYLAEDIKKFQPSVITIPRYLDATTQKPSDNYLNRLKKNPDFFNAIEHYQYKKTVTLDRKPLLSIDLKGYDRYQEFDLYTLKSESK